MGIPIISEIIKGVLGVGKDIADEFIRSPEERDAFHLRLEEEATKRQEQWESTFRRELEAKEQIIVAEMKQDDKFTKRARPSIAYSGLVFTFMEVIVRGYMLFSGTDMPEGFDTIVPPQFWLAWAGVTGTWAVGRSMEKRASIQSKETGRLTKLITGE